MRLIAIHSMPRSGSTWLGSIIDSSPEISYKLQPLFSYKLKGYLSKDSSLSRIEEFKKSLLDIEDDFLDQKEKKDRGIIPCFKKDKIQAVAYKETRYHFVLENLLEKDPEAKLIGLVRNPLAMLNSWFHAPKEFEASWKIEEEWKTGEKKINGKAEEYYGYDKWKEVVNLFHALELAFPKKVITLNYKHLLLDPITITKEIFSFLEIPYSRQTENFLVRSRNNNVDDPYGVFKSKLHDDNWKVQLPEFIIDEVFNDLMGTSLEQYLK